MLRGTATSHLSSFGHLGLDGGPGGPREPEGDGFVGRRTWAWEGEVGVEEAVTQRFLAAQRKPLLPVRLVCRPPRVLRRDPRLDALRREGEKGVKVCREGRTACIRAKSEGEMEMDEQVTEMREE